MHLVLAAIHIEASPRAVPLGPAMLASVLKQAFGTRIQSRVLDLYLEQSAEECATRILESDPDAVGLSMYVWNRTQALEIAAQLKQRKPGILVFAGGAEATADVQGVLADSSIDFVLPGEGETLIVETMGRLLEGELPEAIAASVQPHPIKDLSTLPSPFLDGTLPIANYSGALWELSRGCPFACDFCFESRGTAGTLRIPMERVEAELELFEANGIREVFVLDPTFNYHKAGAKQVLRLIAERAPDIHFFFEIRAEFLDQEMAQLFSAVRCTLQIGLQSAHDAVLKNINRTFNAKDFESKLLLLHQAGVPYGFDLIYGLPGDCLDGFCASLDFAMSLVPNHLDVFRLSVLPGTRLAETAPGLGLQYQAENPYAVIASPTFGVEDMERASRIALGCDVLYNHGKAVPWFGMILEGLELPPSTVFERFATFMTDRSNQELTLLQRDFIANLFDEREDGLMGSIAADIITYFGYSAELLDAAEPMTIQAHFEHHPEALLMELQSGSASLEELVFSLPPHPCEALLYLDEGEVRIEIQSN